MAPLSEKTLGKQQHHLNILVKESITNEIPFEDIKLLSDTSDLDNLIKIDVASHYRNVDYIINVLKSEDMLHVSRAIKQSSWLITDNQYANIINPNHLHDVLLPQMISKAAKKFLLQVRLILKDEARANEFFKYYEDNDKTTAFKWLPSCSVECIKSAMEKYYDDINEDTFKRLCERTFSVLEIYAKKTNHYHTKRQYVKRVMFLMQNNTVKFLDIFESLNNHGRMPNLGPKHTGYIMKECPERILEKFHEYARCIDEPTFIKYLGKENIKYFLLKQAKNPKLKLWFRYENIKTYVKMMPKEGKFEFLKQVFIDKQEPVDDVPAFVQSDEIYCGSFVPCARMAYMSKTSSSKSVYQWYRHAPFDIAYTELKKLIRIESSPDERIAMILIMLGCAGNNLKHIEEIIRYFHDRHINEPFNIKSQFTNTIFSTKKVHQFQEKCWKTLEEIFYSMEVYSESDRNVQKCLEAIIVYKILHHEQVSDIIKGKFELNFSTIKSVFAKLNEDERDMIFKYLYNILEAQLKRYDENDYEGFCKVVSTLLKMINLSKDWKKDLPNRDYLESKIKELFRLKKEKSLPTDLSIFYEDKFWRRRLYEEYFMLSPSQDACLYALKYDLQLLKRHPTEVQQLRRNVSLKTFLSKLRIYYPNSLCLEWVKAYREDMAQTTGLESVARSLCTLLSPDELMLLINKYAPEKPKVTWSDADEIILNLQKYIAKNMHIARPQPPLDAVLLFCKGDYFQYALPSFHSICYNMTSQKCRLYIPTLIEAPVSIQKHGIRLAFNKLKINEVMDLFLNTWKTAKNSSIRAVLFKLTHKLLTREKSTERMLDLWSLLESFIDDLDDDENKDIYNLMGQLNSVPEELQAQYCMKSYTFLKALPLKVGCTELANNLASHSAKLMETIDPDFVKEILIEYVENLIKHNKISSNENTKLSNLLAAYVICAESDELQMERYKLTLLPVFSHCFKNWSETADKIFVIQNFYFSMLESLGNTMKEYVKSEKFKVPVKLFETIQIGFKNEVSIIEYYERYTAWRLLTIFVDCISEVKPEIDFKIYDKQEKSCFSCYTDEDVQWNMLCEKVMPILAQRLINVLKEEIQLYFDTIYSTYSKAVEAMFNMINISYKAQIIFYEMLLTEKTFVPGYLTAIQLIPTYYFDDLKPKFKELLLTIKENECVQVKIHYYEKFGHGYIESF